MAKTPRALIAWEVLKIIRFPGGEKDLAIDRIRRRSDVIACSPTFNKPPTGKLKM